MRITQERIGIESSEILNQQENGQSSECYMDELTLECCQQLNASVGFVTDIAAGHITRIGREADGT